MRPAQCWSRSSVLGALALNDIWFGGQTMNPWLLEEGASGSSAGPGAATAAGLVGFSIGSETGGSIVSPSMRCGVTGLRPTYRPGRADRSNDAVLVARQAGTDDARRRRCACWCSKRSTGPDGGDVYSVPSKLDFDASASVKGLRVGYFPPWMKENPATDVDRAALETVKKVGMEPVEVALPDWPYDSLKLILFAEGAAAFEELTLISRTGPIENAGARRMAESFSPGAIPFRGGFCAGRPPAAQSGDRNGESFFRSDLLLVPSLRDEMLTITQLHRASFAYVARRLC